MSKPYDAGAKSLIDVDPIAWLRFCGLPGEKAEAVDSDLTTTLTSDRLFRIITPGQPDYLLHVEFQVSYDPKLCHRCLAYHVAAGYKNGLPVITVIVLLRPKADGRAIVDQFRFGAVQLDLQVVRIWEHSPEEILTGPPSLLSVLPLTKIKDDDLPKYIRAVQSITTGLDRGVERDIWARMKIFFGLTHSKKKTEDLLRGILQMLDLKESWAYQEIIAEGEALGEARGEERGKAIGKLETERDILVRLGTKRLNEPDEATRSAISAISSADRLSELIDRLLEVDSWQELLAWPSVDHAQV